MPPRGPQPQEHKRRRGLSRVEGIEVENVPYEGSRPELSRARTWPQQTLEWWEAISRMPHCVLWEDSDWRYALDAAEIHALFQETSQANFASELRQREKVMGTTWDYRRNLRISYVDAASKDEGTVTAIDDYRSRIQGG